jgi:hypothetical protein
MRKSCGSRRQARGDLPGVQRAVPHVGTGPGGRLVAGGGRAGAVTGLVVFGAVAGAGSRSEVAGLVIFLPAALGMTVFGLVPETCGREPEDLWPGS